MTLSFRSADTVEVCSFSPETSISVSAFSLFFYLFVGSGSSVSQVCLTHCPPSVLSAGVTGPDTAQGLTSLPPPPLIYGNAKGEAKDMGHAMQVPSTEIHTHQVLFLIGINSCVLNNQYYMPPATKMQCPASPSTGTSVFQSCFNSYSVF